MNRQTSALTCRTAACSVGEISVERRPKKVSTLAGLHGENSFIISLLEISEASVHVAREMLCNYL